MIVLMGNPAAQESYRDRDPVTGAELDDPQFRAVDGHRVFKVNIPDGEYNLIDAFKAITESRGAWAMSTQAGEDGRPVNPTWVWSDSPGMEMLLSEHFGCEIGVPEDVEDTHYTDNGPPGVGPTVVASVPEEVVEGEI